jgi:hypothetical protein
MSPTDKTLARPLVLFDALLAVLIIAGIGVTLWVALHFHSQLLSSQRRGCERGIHERLTLIEEAKARITGNLAIVADPRQPTRTKAARLHEARIEERIIGERRARLDPLHGGKLVCSKVYP